MPDKKVSVAQLVSNIGRIFLDNQTFLVFLELKNRHSGLPRPYKREQRLNSDGISQWVCPRVKYLGNESSYPPGSWCLWIVSLFSTTIIIMNIFHY